MTDYNNYFVNAHNAQIKILKEAYKKIEQETISREIAFDMFFEYLRTDIDRPSFNDGNTKYGQMIKQLLNRFSSYRHTFKKAIDRFFSVEFTKITEQYPSENISEFDFLDEAAKESAVGIIFKYSMSNEEMSLINPERIYYSDNFDYNSFRDFYLESELVIDPSLRLQLNLSKGFIHNYFEELIGEIPDFDNTDLACFLGANFDAFEFQYFGKKLDLSTFSRRVKGTKNAEQFVYNLYNKNKGAAGKAKIQKHSFAVLLEKNFKGFEYDEKNTKDTYNEHILKLRGRIRNHNIKLNK